MGFGNKKFLFQFLVDILPLGSGDPHIFEDPDPGSQNLADPTDPDLDPKHCWHACITTVRYQHLPLKEELNVPRHLSVGKRVRSILEFKNMGINALAFIMQHEERIQGTFRSKATLDRNICHIGLDSWGGDNDIRDFDEFGHLVALEATDGGSDFYAAQGDSDILELVFRVTGSGRL